MNEFEATEWHVERARAMREADDYDDRNDDFDPADYPQRRRA